jgi:hypothetical protein
MIKYRTIEKQDILKYYSAELPFLIEGYSVFKNDDLIGFVGIRKCDGYNLLFSDIKTLDIPKITIWRIAKKLVIRLTEKYDNILSVANDESSRFLESLGYMLHYEIEEQKVYRWQTRLH